MAATTDRRLARLHGEQAAASMPTDNVWLSASAGTGKTFVLAARVLRLLLGGARPDAILCLTFTRAGAAEMADRVHRQLADWASAADTDVRSDLTALGEPNGPEDIRRARRLFARLLEARGGGLRVMTIHAFCQTLLGTFPLEAGLSPGFRAVEGREEAALAARVLADLAETAEREGDRRLTTALGALSLRLSEQKAEDFLLRSSRDAEALDALPEAIEAAVRRAFDIPAEFGADELAILCDDTHCDRDGLAALAAMQADWNTKTGLGNAQVIGDWLAASPAERAASLDTLRRALSTKEGTLPKARPKAADYDEIAERVVAWCTGLCALVARAALATDIAHALVAARRYSRAYASAKAAAGLVDFNDLIKRANALLSTKGMGDWIAYKLDQATDHILVDEAQDTNADQWSIVKAVSGEFWAGEGAKGDAVRTLFTVGDYKQAIYGFQGTHPRHYAKARDEFSATIEGSQRELVDLGLNRSFRSSQAVLDVVDAMLDELGHAAFGEHATARHRAAKSGPGCVVLLPPVRVDPAQGDDASSEDEEGWVAPATRVLADRIAGQVRRWLDDGHRLARAGRAVRPGDIMILVRKRTDLAALLVARLHKEGVPVAGVDRLRLAAPLVVKDCLAAVRFAIQPDDDLNLAALLVSPIIGWSQDQLYGHARGPRSGSLWRKLRADGADLDVLRTLLAMADFGTPYSFLEAMLSGPIGARAKLLRRLGNAAADPIDELLGAALQFERDGAATLQTFIDWFDRGEGTVKREPGGAGDAVRVMTVHGAKGLEAPLVILADAAIDPGDSRQENFAWPFDDQVMVPIFRPRKHERALDLRLEHFAARQQQEEFEENARLLYVAMTRAAEQLWVAGALGRRRTEAPEDSWHGAIERALMRLDAPLVTDAVWGDMRIHGELPAAGGGRDRSRAAPSIARPIWIDAPAPTEARPPRPLAPSSLGPDQVAEPPPTPAMRAAAERGRLLHALFERLPGLAPERRKAAALAWLEGSARVDDADDRDALAHDALAAITAPESAHLFAVDGLTEVPIAGVVDGAVISGTVDRLVIGDGHVDVIDFKTARRVPASPAQVPDAYKRQMAAYVAVLGGVFPGRTIRATLLYTGGPTLFTFAPDDLANYRPVPPSTPQ